MRLLSTCFALLLTLSTLALDQVSFTFPTTSESEGTNSVLIQVDVINPDTITSMVSVEILPASDATQGADYTFDPDTLIFPASDASSQFITVTLINDPDPEFSEYVFFKISSLTDSTSVVDSLHELKIRDNDPVPQGNCMDLFISEYLEGWTSAERSLELFNPTSDTIHLDEYAIFVSTNGGAFEDTTRLSGVCPPDSAFVICKSNALSAVLAQADLVDNRINFNGNDAVQIWHYSTLIDVIGVVGEHPSPGWQVDTGNTNNFTLVRSPYVYRGTTNWYGAASQQYTPFPAPMTDSMGHHFMHPCNTPPPGPPSIISFLDSSLFAIESDGTVNVWVDIDLSHVQDTTWVWMKVNSGASTALPTIDYILVDTLIPFYPGSDDSLAIPIELVNDLILEPLDTLELYLEGTGQDLDWRDTSFQLYILDNDAPPTMQFWSAGQTRSEGEDSIKVFVTTSNFSDQFASVDVIISGGGATPGSDYTFTPWTANFPANDTSSQVGVIYIIDDVTGEPNEQLVLELQNAVNGDIGVNHFTLFITDNDYFVGLNETHSELTIYPNPASRELHFNSTDRISQLTIFDNTGRLVQQMQNVYPGQPISIEELPQGNYIINLDINESIYIKKFTKE